MKDFHFSFCIFFIFLKSFVFGVYIKDEKPSTKPPLQVEDLPWHSFFDEKSSSNERKSSRVQRTNVDLVSHSTLCPPGETGQFPYPPDCKRFINCWKGRGSIQVCAPGTLFNSETFECDFPGKVKCDDGFEGFGSQKPFERYVRFPHQRPEIMHNPRVARTNQKEPSKPDSVPARPYPGRPPYFGPSHLLPPTRPTNQSQGREVRPQCTLGATGLYPHPFDCTKFLKCWSGNTYIQNCGPGTFFNPLISACDHPRNVPCAHEEGYQPAVTAEPVQPIQPVQPVPSEDAYVPEESVQYEQYQKVKAPITKGGKKTIRPDPESPNYDDDLSVASSTPKTEIDDLEPLSHAQTKRKPKIINTESHQQQNQFTNVQGQVPVSHLIPPQYDVYGNPISQDNNKQVNLGVQPSNNAKVETEGPGAYPSNPFVINYPPQGPYATLNPEDQKKPDQLKQYHAHMFNKKHPHHPGHPFGPFHPHHPSHPKHPQHPQHPHHPHHPHEPSPWLVPPPFRTPYYAPYHPFFPTGETYSSQNVPQPSKVMHVPYYPTYISVMKPCSKSDKPQNPNAPQCEPNTFGPSENDPPTLNNKPYAIPAGYTPVTHQSGTSQTQQGTSNSFVSTYPQKPDVLNQGFDSQPTSNQNTNFHPSQYPSGNQLGSDFTPQVQINLNPNTPQNPGNQYYQPSSYTPQTDGSSPISSGSTNVPQNPSTYNQPAYNPHLPTIYPQKQENSSPYNPNFSQTPSIQGNVQPQPNQGSAQPSNRPYQPGGSVQILPSSPQTPQYQPYLFFYYPMNSNLYPYNPMAYYPNQNTNPQAPPNTPTYTPTSQTNSNPGQAPVPDPFPNTDKTNSPQYQPSAPVYVNPYQKPEEQKPEGQAPVPDPFDNKNYITKDYDLQPNNQFSNKVDNVYPTRDNENSFGSPVYNRPKDPESTKYNLNIISTEPPAKESATFPPFPGKTNSPKTENIKTGVKTSLKQKEYPKEYLTGKIDVRTVTVEDDSLEDVETVPTTQPPVKKRGSEKVDETFVKTNPKPFYTHPDKYSQPEESKTKDKKPEVTTEEPTKKTIQPESDFDVEPKVQKPKKPVKKPYVKVKNTPPNGQVVRLRNGASHLDGYLEMKDPKSKWGLVCDHSGQWGIAEATVACRELGFIRGAELSWQGYPIKSDSEVLYVAVNGINCTGEETSLSECEAVHNDANSCDVSRNAVGLRCFDNLASHCQPGEILYNQHCYKLHGKENPDDPWIKTEEASEQCKKFGGKLVDITSQYENDFISEWLIKKHPDVTAVATGGIGISVLGRPMWLWEGTSDPMVYERWWSGWSGDQDIPKGSINGPLCIILRKTFSCSDDDDEQKKTEPVNEENTCSADYFFWDVEDCEQLRTSVFICERPMDDIGCIVGNGEGYVGTANTTASGRPCLPWDHPKVVEGLARRRAPQERSSRLVGHNYCRNLGMPDRHPWCFVEGKGNSEYCAIPQCWDSVSGPYSRSLGSWSSCDADHFECKPGECIRKDWVCDGQKDCSNARDEDSCQIFLQEFTMERNKKMGGKGNEKWPNVNENICAKLCLENKNFKCRSFSYNFRDKECLLSETNVGLSGQVVVAKGWVYHERTSESVKCTLDNGFFGCQNGKCINISNVCDGKINCADGSDERDCGRLGYQIRLAGGNEKHIGRVEVKVLGKWGVVCDDMFDLRDAEVVCRELGFKLGAAEVHKHSQFPVENPLFLVDHLDCRGNETSIRECHFPGWGKHNCGPEEVVGVSCRVPGIKCPDEQWQCLRSKECIPLEYLCDKENVDCDDGSDEDKRMCEAPTQIRLVGGPNATSGRLEIRHFNVWGTVCDDDFDEDAAKSVCNMLGFKGPSMVKNSSFFGEGKGPIWLEGGLCFVNETDLKDCTNRMKTRNNCQHDEDVSIFCSHEKSSAIKPIAASSADSETKRTEEKLRQVLITECSGKPKTKPKILRNHFERVVGGSTVTREALPWQASVRVRSGNGKSLHWCGAIVISPYHILTAGHCLRDYNKALYFIRVGDYDTNVLDPDEHEYAIEHLYMHPEFSKDINLNNDIGLVKIKGEIPFGDHIRPACLAPSRHIYLPGTNCSVSGWGSVSANSAGFVRTLRRAFVPILEPSVCSAPYVYGDSLSEGMFCAGLLDGGVDSCQGDSGGPLMCQHDGREYLFGITSWGHGCGRANKPGVYTNVAFYAEWIQQKIKSSMS